MSLRRLLRDLTAVAYCALVVALMLLAWLWLFEQVNECF